MAPVAGESITPRQIAVCALSIAEGYASAGVHEEGGNNRGDQVEFFQKLIGGRPGDPWCADFVCTCLVKAYARLHGLNEDREHLPGYVEAVGAALLPLSGSCAELEAGARRRSLWRGPELMAFAAAGDLVLFDFGRLGRANHVVVKRARPSTPLEVYTVEGNTVPGGGAGSQRDGGGVFLRVRSLALARGFVHFGAGESVSG